MVHILMLGSTGPTGLEFVQAALAANHQVTLYVKAPGSLPGGIGSNPNVRVVVYDRLGDYDSLERVVACGAMVFVSLLEEAHEGTKGSPITDTMRFIFHLLTEFRYKRALILGTTAYTAPEDKGSSSLKWKASSKLTKMTGGDAFKDFAELGAWISTQRTELVRWTLFRVPLKLTGGSAKAVTATYAGSGKDRTSLSRKSLVGWILEEMVKGEWVGKTPVVCN